MVDWLIGVVAIPISQSTIRHSPYQKGEHPMYEKSKPIVVGADHLGLPLKDKIRDYLRQKGYTVEDMGVSDTAPVDYPDVGAALAQRVGAGEFERGILVCGTGAGMAIVANKVPGVRAVSVQDPYTAERAVASNNAQIITFGSQIVGASVAEKLIDIWLESEFQGGRSAPKVQKIDALDEKYKGQ
jgi:ribose 5-phosphate isomerase B